MPHALKYKVPLQRLNRIREQRCINQNTKPPWLSSADRYPLPVDTGQPVFPTRDLKTFSLSHLVQEVRSLRRNSRTLLGRMAFASSFMAATTTGVLMYIAF